MADSDFNFGPNFPPGGAPENPRVNSAAFDAETKKAQQAQTDTIKGLTETIKELTKKYDEITESNKKLSEEETQTAKLLRDKIDTLSEILVSVKQSAATGSPAPLSSVGIKERTETFTNLTTVIKSFQRSAAELRASGKEIDFDSWFAEFVEQKKADQLSLQQQQYNYMLLNDVKDILKQSGTSLANLSDDELETIAKRSIQLSIEQKQRELQVIQQNKDVIKLNKEATAQEIANTKELIESRKYDPSKFVIEKGFRGIGKDLDRIIENTKPRSLLKIVLDLMGPFGAVIKFFIDYTIKPLMFAFAVIAGFLLVQYTKLKSLGQLLSGEIFINMYKSLILVKDGLKFVFRDLPLMISTFINGWAIRTANLYDGVSKTGRFFGLISSKSEAFFYAWTRLISFMSKIPSEFSKLYDFLNTYEKTMGGLKIFGKLYVFIGDIVTGIGRVVPMIGRILAPIGSIGRGILNAATGISNLAARIYSPIATFFSTNRLASIILLLDRFGFGLSTIVRLGLSVGRFIGGIFAPLNGLIRIISDMPLFFKNLFSGNFYTMIKSILGLVVQVAGIVLASIFGGPIGGLIAAMTLKLENILKWFDPIFDFLIYLGALVFGSLWAIYEDFVSPALDAITKVIMAVLNLAFGLLKPIFKIGQFILIALAPIIAVLIYAFKALGYVFKGIGMLADALTNYVIDPIFKFMSDFLFKFIQPIYDWLAGTWIGKMLGMETKAERKRREASEAAQKESEKKKEKIKSASEGFSFTVPSGVPVASGVTIDSQKINEGIGKTKQVVTETVDKSITFLKSTLGNLDLTLSGLGDRLKEFALQLKTIIISMSASFIGVSRALGVKAADIGTAAINELNTPENRNILFAATTPINYSTARSIKPTYTSKASTDRADLEAFVGAMKQQSDMGKQGTAGIVNNQQTTVVNNTSGLPMITMPSNSERTANQINNSFRPAG